MSKQYNSPVRMIDPIRNTSKSPTTRGKPFQTSDCQTRRHQHHASRLQETRNRGVMRQKSGGKGRPARLCPSADDCQDVDEVGTEPSSDADSDLFGPGLER